MSDKRIVKENRETGVLPLAVGICDVCGKKGPLVQSTLIEGDFCRRDYQIAYYRLYRNRKGRARNREKSTWQDEDLADLIPNYLSKPRAWLVDRYARSWDAIVTMVNVIAPGTHRPRGLDLRQVQRASDAHHKALCERYFGDTPEPQETHPLLRGLFLSSEEREGARQR